METKFDPKTKVRQGDLGPAADGKQPNQQPKNIDFNECAPGKYQSKNYLDRAGAYTTKSGKEHVQESLFKSADQKDY